MPSLLQMHLVTYWFTTSQWNAVERLEGRNFCQTMVGWKETLWRATSALGSYFLRTQFVLKFGFSEKATKFEKNIRRTFDKSVVFCARNSVIVKKSTTIFFKCGQVVLTCFEKNLEDHYLIFFYYRQYFKRNVYSNKSNNQF